MSRTRTLAAVVATLLALPASAVAQTQTDTTPLGDYSQPGTTSTVETTPPTSGTAGESTSGEGGDAATTPAQGGGAPTQSGGGEGSGAPATAADTPAALAFTGFEAGIVALLGVALMGGAVVLQRRRRTS